MSDYDYQYGEQPAQQQGGYQQQQQGGYGQQPQQQYQQQQYQQPQQPVPYQYDQQPQQYQPQLLTGGAKAMYIVLGMFVPFIGAIVLLNSGRQYPEGRYREAAKYFAIGCAVSIALSIVNLCTGALSSVAILSDPDVYSSYSGYYM